MATTPDPSRKRVFKPEEVSVEKMEAKKDKAVEAPASIMMKVVALIPGNELNLPIDTIVTAEPCRHLKGFFNIRTERMPAPLYSVPGEFLEGVC